MNPKISIITVVYNGIDYMEQTIQSVIGQTYFSKEYIVIDGGSVDGTIDIIRKYKTKIDKWISEVDGGIYDAMNKGINMATGDWIIFMNCGDFFYDRFVLDRIFANPIPDDIALINGKTKIRSSWGVFLKPQTELWKSFSHQSIFSRSEIAKKYSFNLEFKVSSDYNFVYTILSDGYSVLNSDVIVSDILYSPYGFGAKRIIQLKKETLKSIILNRKKNPKFVLHYLYHCKKLVQCLVATEIEKYFPKMIMYIRVIRDKNNRFEKTGAKNN
jgi:glycosyltransferase involved in cell wall biosynthesis